MITVGVLGTLHDEGMREEYNYSLDRMKAIIVSFEPDIICGEVRPEDWECFSSDPYYEGYVGPNEYKSMIFELCKSKDIEFRPVDWFEDDLVTLDSDEGKSEDEIIAFKAKFNGIIDEYMRAGVSSVIPFNSIEYNNIVRKKQNLQFEYNPKVHNIEWIVRNQIMILRIIKVIENNPGKRILCTVGAEHCYYYCDELENLSDIGFVFPLE